MNPEMQGEDKGHLRNGGAMLKRANTGQQIRPAQASYITPTWSDYSTPPLTISSSSMHGCIGPAPFSSSSARSARSLSRSTTRPISS